METDDALLREYIVESLEHLANIETDLLAVEAQGADIDEVLVNKVFRAAHSIKGGSGFFSLPRIQELSHKVENVLDMIRSREMVPTPEVVNILLLSFDKLREMLTNFERSNEADIGEFVVALTGLTSSALPQDEKPSLRSNVEATTMSGKPALQISQFELDRSRKHGEFVYLVEYDLMHDVHRRGKTPLDVFKTMEACGTVIDCAVDFQAVGTLEEEILDSAIPLIFAYSTVMDPTIIGTLFEVSQEKIRLFQDAMPEPEAPADEPAAAKNRPRPAPGAPRAGEPSTSAATAGGSGVQVESSLRVNVSLLESLMNLAGELVLSRNQLTEALTRTDVAAVRASSQRISLVTSELQEAIMLTRMQPIGNIFNKFPRVVRDLARDLGKEVNLEIYGREVEMDKTIIEGLSDPLTHMVRNSVDHGVEMPEVRVKSGKSAAGCVTLKAYHEAGQVVVEISDDGKGLDAQKIAASAVSKGLITQEQAKGMSTKEMCSLVFMPGLSTAEQVTDISGRGVGMDVVKTNLDQLGGKVDIETEPGRGSTFRIKLPLTLAIIPSLLVSVGGQRFAIPQVNACELIRITADQAKSRIEVIGNAEVLLLRGSLVPIVYLADVLGMPRTYVDPVDEERKPDRRERLSDRRSPHRGVEEASGPAGNAPNEQRRESDRRYRAASDLNIVVVTAGAFQYGLVVESLHDTVEIVVKPLGRHLKHLREYAGATIMGDGRLALILDVAGIAAKRSLSSMDNSIRAKELAQQAEREGLKEVHSFLLFRNGPEESCAMPLSLVARVEEVQKEQVEILGGKRTMQYRGASLPLVTLRDAAQVAEIQPSQDLVVVVFEASGREIGLLATMPVDVIETDAEIDQNTFAQRGVMGSSIIHGATTLLIDVHELVEAVYPDWGAERSKSLELGGPSGTATVLLAEDSDFFRNHVTKCIESAGLKVIAGEDGLAAWELLEKNAEKISMVVTDIEMPRMTGLELTKAIRADKRFAHLPIIALTSLASEEDVARGKAVGVDDYQVKLDKEKLIEGISNCLKRAMA